MDTELMDCLARLQGAIGDYRSQLERDANADATTDAANLILVARGELYRCLTRAGWKPPKAVESQMDYDALLLAQRDRPHFT